MLCVTDVESGYGDLTILRGISFELAPGEVLAVLDPLCAAAVKDLCLDEILFGG